jgi:hypothetical protein
VANVRRFERFAVIDWSGQNVARPKGLAIAIAERGDAAPKLVDPPNRRWSRSDVVDWIRAEASSDIVIGLDLSPGLPFVDRGAFFPGWEHSPPDAKALWRDVERHSDASRHLSANGFLSHAEAREHFLHQTFRGKHYAPANGRLRRCEERQADMGLSPSSCFKLIGANQVGKSSLTGMRVLTRVNDLVPIWPFNPVPETGAVLIEIYTSIAALAGGRAKGRTKMRSWEDCDAALTHPNIGSRPTGNAGEVDDHTTDAILTAAWLRAVAHKPELWQPADLSPEIAATEGWTFGAL